MYLTALSPPLLDLKLTMERGFLLRSQEKKAAAKRTGTPGQKQTELLAPASEPQPVPRNLEGFEANNQGNNLGKAPCGTLTQEGKGRYDDYDLNKKTRYRRFNNLEFDPSITEFSSEARDVTTIPQPVPDDETQCQWIFNRVSTKEKVLNTPGYPARISKPSRPGLYEVRSTLEMGVGLFAKRNINRGELFLAERPLLVSPHAVPSSQGPIPNPNCTPQQIRQTIMLEYESFLECTIARLPSESQADFRALHNAHTADGSGLLLGIIRSNAYATGSLYDGSDKTAYFAKYGAVCKIGSRINHSCVPNVKYDFKINSFSMQFYALRDINAGEQLFYSYCSAESTRAQRQTELAPYGFVCKCPACVHASPETDKLRTTFGSRITLLSNMVVQNTSRISNEAVLEDALRLEKDMIREGLDTNIAFVGLLAAVSLAYRKLGKMKESEKYRELMKVLQ